MAKLMKERKLWIDDMTGIEVVQLTTFPVMHHHQYCYGQWIAADDETLLYFGARELARDSAGDLWRVNADGSDMALLVEGGAWSAISPDSEWVYSGVGNRIVRVPLQSGRGLQGEIATPEVLAQVDDAAHVSADALSADGRYVFGQAGMTGGGMGCVRLDLTTGEAVVTFTSSGVMHLQLHKPDRLLASTVPPGMENGIYTFSFDGDDFRKLPFTRSTNHYASLGSSDTVATTVPYPDAAIEVATPGGESAYVLAQGPSFWHPTSDASGEWIASDTNWPDTGLHLIHAPTGRYRVLCFTDTSGGHPQWQHAHPRMSPNAKYVVFDSDRTGGISHVYAAHIPDEFKRDLREGRVKPHVV